MQQSPTFSSRHRTPFLIVILGVTLLILLAGRIGSPSAEDAKGGVNLSPSPAKGSLTNPGQEQGPIVIETRQSNRQSTPATPSPPKQPQQTPFADTQTSVPPEPPPETWPKGFQGDLTSLNQLRHLDITRRPPRQAQRRQQTPPYPELQRPQVFNIYPTNQPQEPYPYYYPYYWNYWSFPHYWRFPRSGHPPFLGGFVPGEGFRGQVFTGRGHLSSGRGFKGEHSGFRGGRGFGGW